MARRRVVRFDPPDPREVKAAVREVLELASDQGVRVTTSIAQLREGRADRVRSGRGSGAARAWAPGGKPRIADERRKAERARA
jgi:hypothetical protein